MIKSPVLLCACASNSHTGEPYKDTANSLACYQLALQQLAVEASPELELVPEVRELLLF